MADVGVQVKTVEADQDEANPNEMGLIHEVEVAAAALKLTDQPDDLTMIQKTLTVILTSFWLKRDPSYEKRSLHWNAAPKEQADIMNQTFKLKCALRGTYTFKKVTWLCKIQPTWFIQVNRLDSMWPNVSFLLT